MVLVQWLKDVPEDTSWWHAAPGDKSGRNKKGKRICHGKLQEDSLTSWRISFKKLHGQVIIYECSR